MSFMRVVIYAAGIASVLCSLATFLFVGLSVMAGLVRRCPRYTIRVRP